MVANEKTLFVAGATFCLSVATSAIVTWYLVTSHIENALDQQPLIAIAGYERVRKEFNLETTEAEMNAAYEDMNQKIDRLKKHNYLVIDERVVVTAPESYFVPVKKVGLPDEQR